MGDIMAFTALGETCHHTSRMRCSVAALAGRKHLVFFLVAGHTENGLVLGSGLGMQLRSLFVT